MNEPIRSSDIKVDAYFIGLLSYADLAPLLDALEDHFWYVHAERWSTEPPAVSGIGPDTALVLSFIRDHGAALAVGVGAFSATTYWAGFIQKMGEDSWDKVRNQIVRRLSRGKVKGGGAMQRRYMPLVIRFDTMRFVFEGEMTEEELRARLDRAAHYVSRLPDGESLPRFGNPERNWCYWNPNRQAWEATAQAVESDDGAMVEGN